MTSARQLTPTLETSAEAVVIDWGSGEPLELPHLWLRDNCDCEECRITQTSEKRFLLAGVPRNLAPANVELLDDRLFIEWPDGHRTRYDGEFLQSFSALESIEAQDWPHRYVPMYFDYSSFIDKDDVATQAIEEFLAMGAIVLANAPRERGTLEHLASRLGPIREVLFDRIHDVRVDPSGYNVAHTPLPLPPHNDFASYTWPPSVQALHMLTNEAEGGLSIIVDGWSLLTALRDEHPDMFKILCEMPVPFREFDDDTETYAVEPIVRCDTQGNITGFRFSNQLMQTIDPHVPHLADFYRAYHELCCRVADPRRYAKFRLNGGDILVVAAHRVLHGRDAFVPTGQRHLQDAYFEFDNVRNALTVLRRRRANHDD